MATQIQLHKAAHFVTLNLGGGWPAGGGVLHDNDYDDDTYMTPLGRFDLRTRPKNSFMMGERHIRIANK